MRSQIIISGLAIVLAFSGAIAPAIAQPIAPIITPKIQLPKELETTTAEIDRLFKEGIKEGNNESLLAAIQQFERALKLSEVEGQKTKQRFLLLTLGRIHEALGEKQKALSLLNQALSISSAVGDSPEERLRQRSVEATTLNYVGQVYNALGNPQKALDFYNQALSISQSLGDSSEERLRQQSVEATTLSNIGDIHYYFLGQQQKALVFFNQALLLNRAVGDPSKVAENLFSISSIYSGLGKPQKALEHYTQALPLFRTAGDRSRETSVLVSIGSIYSELGEQQKALEFYNQSLTISRTVGDSPEEKLRERSREAAILTNIGQIYRDLDEKQKSLEYYTQALPLFRAVSNRSDEALTLTSIGGLYSSLGEKQKALEFFNQILPLSRMPGEGPCEACTLTIIARAHNDLGDRQKALEFYSQALRLWRATDYRGGEAETLKDIGEVYSALGEKQKALEFYNQALPLYRAMKNRDKEAVTLSYIGNVYSGLGEKSKALEFYNQALLLNRAMSDSPEERLGQRIDEATTLSNIGLVYLDLGENTKALELFNQALLIQQAVGNPPEEKLRQRRGEGITLLNIGAVYNELGETTKALEFYNQALLIHRAMSNRDGEAATLDHIGSIYNALGEKSKALEFQNQALLLWRAVGDREGEAGALNSIGRVYSDLGENEKALEYYNQALPILRVVCNFSCEAATLSNIASLFIKQQPEVAIVFYKQSINLYENLRKNIRQLPKGIQETYAKSVSKPYRRLADTLLSQGRIGEAQQVLELLKIQDINDITEGTRSATSLAQVALSQTEQEIIKKHTSLIDFGKQLYDCEQTKCSRLSNYQTQYKKLTQAYDRFLEDIKIQLTNTRTQEVDAGTKTFIANADRIVTTQPNTALIYPLVLEDKVRILWATKGGALNQAECPLGEAQLSQLVEQFRTALQTTNDLNPVQQAGKQLYNCLIPPKLQAVLKQAKIDNLIFVPDRITNYIPMAALHDGKQYLIEQYSVSNILAASFTDTDSRFPKKPSILGFGLSQAITLTNPSRQFSALPYVPSELDAIIKRNTPDDKRGIFPGQELLDQDFTKDRLAKALLDKPNILHIATHGEFNPADPRTSYLVLGDGSPYPISDIQYLRNLSNIHLVVLSACETALGGRDRNGLEIAGISSYFLGDPSKAKAVLASLWKVNDPATSLFMADFYKALNPAPRQAKSLSKTQALREVQLGFIRSKLTLNDAADRAGIRLTGPTQNRPQALSHPYYWAPFVLIGNSL